MPIKESKDLDDLDIAILRELSCDCRSGYTAIANKLKKSPLTIKKHIEDLEEMQIIPSWGAKLNYEALGYEIIAIIEINIAKGSLIEVEKRIAEHPNVFGVYDVTGEFDCLVMVRVRNRRELSNIIKKLLRSDEIIRTNTHIALNVIKESSNYDLIKNYEENLLITDSTDKLNDLDDFS